MSRAAMQTNESSVRVVLPLFDDGTLFPSVDSRNAAWSSTIVVSCVLSVAVVGATVQNLTTPIRLNLTESLVNVCMLCM